MKSRPNDKPQRDKIKDAARESQTPMMTIRASRYCFGDLAKPKERPSHFEQ